MSAQAVRSSKRLLLIGMGAMGYPLAFRLNQFFHVYTYDIFQEPCLKHQQEFGTVFAGEPCFNPNLPPLDFICTLVPNSQHVDIYIDQYLQYGKTITPPFQPTWIDFTSGNGMLTQGQAEKLRQAGIGFVDAPVSGGTRGARHGTLSIMYSGLPNDTEKAYEVFSKMGPPEKLNCVGSVPGHGHAIKSINNMLYACNLLFTAKGIQALQSFGVDPMKATKCITSSSGGSEVSKKVIEYLTHGGLKDYFFKTSLMVKDSRNGFSLIPEGDRIRELIEQCVQVHQELAEERGEHQAELWDMWKHIEEGGYKKKNPRPRL